MADLPYYPYVSNGTASTITYTNVYQSTTAPAPVQQLQAPRLPEATLKPEDPIAWLRRRVAEVCWTPA